MYIEKIERYCRGQYEWLVAGAYRSMRLSAADAVMFVHQSSGASGLPENIRATMLLHLFKPNSLRETVTGDAFILGRAGTDVPDALARVVPQT
jgi:hypothetical protein